MEFGSQAGEDIPAAVATPAKGEIPTSVLAEDAVESPAAVAPAPLMVPTSPPAAPAGSGMGGDLPPESLPSPPYPECPITEAGAWWTDPADPYTCIPPGSMPFHEPTPPSIDPGLLEPIFDGPGSFHEPTPPGIDPGLLEPIFDGPGSFHEPTPPGIDPKLLEPIFEGTGTGASPKDDCRTTGALQCTVTIMGQDYLVTFADGKPVGVRELQG